MVRSPPIFTPFASVALPLLDVTFQVHGVRAPAGEAFWLILRSSLARRHQPPGSGSRTWRRPGIQEPAVHPTTGVAVNVPESIHTSAGVSGDVGFVIDVFVTCPPEAEKTAAP